VDRHARGVAGMSAAEPPQGANSASRGGSAAAKPQAWGDHTSAQGRPKREYRSAKHDDRQTVAVIGAGWAGCAAAVALAQSGCRVELHEAAPMVGGRARCVVRDGLPLDNGEHLLLGAYADTIDLAAAVRDGGSPSAWTTGPLAIRPLALTQRNALSLTTRNLPASLGLLLGLLGAHGLTLGERFATIRWMAQQRRRQWRCDARMTLAELLAEVPARVRDTLWNPLCVAALNTPPAHASGQVFLNVLRETFGAGARASAIVVPSEGLAEAVPEQASRWLIANGHDVRRSSRTRISDIDADGVLLDSSGQSVRANAVVVAVGPHQLASAFGPGIVERHAPIAAALADVARFDYEPITTTYLGYAAPIALPKGLLRLDEAPGQWLFDRADILRRAAPSPGRPDMGALVSVVISARGPHEALDHRALTRAIDAQLRGLAPGLPALCWSQVIEEKRATYACVPALTRPACGSLTERVYLAGDYTYEAFPATLEAAVRSGRVAAKAVIADQPA
jgi:squalene-associated FAD-dependent desaturase